MTEEMAMQYQRGYIDGFKEGKATFEQKIGQWIPLEYDGYADGSPVWDMWECSECGWEHTGYEESLSAFCPHCGVRMIYPQERSE